MRVTRAKPATKAAASRRPKRPRDYQRARVYRWEGAVVLPQDKELIGLDDCAALVEAVYRWAERSRMHEPGWAPPAVTDGRGRRHACGSRDVIKLPRWARTRPIVLHECAHGLSLDRHGPDFVATYLRLLEHFLGFDQAALRQTLGPHGVDSD